MGKLWKSIIERIDLIVLTVCLVISHLIWKYGITKFDDHFLWDWGLALGILLSFLIYVVVYSLSSANHRAEEIARKMTMDLGKYKLALDSASNHVVITDVDGRVIYANPTVEKLTGYSLSEVIGSTPRLWGRQMDEEFYDNFWKTIKIEKKVFIGTLKNKRKNGEVYDAQATVSPIIDERGQLAGFVGVEEDVTQENMVKRQIAESLSKQRDLNKSLREDEIEMRKLLDSSKLLEKQLAEEKRDVELKVEERTKELSDEKSKLMASISALPRAFLIVDKEANLLTHNDKLEPIFGKQKKDWSIEMVDELIGKSFELKRKTLEVMSSGKVLDIAEFQYQAKFLRIYIAPVLNDEQILIGAVITIKDATEARVLARSKDEFFSIASHELRTPLTAIRGNTSMMLDYYRDAFKDPELKQMIDDTHEASVRLIGIVNDFLDMSRLEMGKVEYKTSNVQLQRIVEKVVKELRENAKTKRVEIKVAGDHLIMAKADEGKLEQILFNIIGNSLKFTDKGSIKIEISKDSNFAKIEIADTGRGIAPENQGLLFHKFQQAGSSLMTREGAKGTGLGLYISKLMTEGMGGKLELIKSVVGKGSTFGISLPRGDKK